MQLIAEAIDTIRQLCEVAFVVLTIVLKGDFGVQLEKRWKDVSESESSARGLGMSEDMSAAGTDLVVPSPNWIR